jgi:hypothetical protein
VNNLIQITREQAAMLRENGRGKDVHMTSKGHKSRAKHYYATLNPKTIKLLGIQGTKLDTWDEMYY